MRPAYRTGPVSAIAIALACAILFVPSLAHAAAPSCTPSALHAGWQTITVHSGTLDRQVPLYVPAAQIGHANLPLVFDLHGSGGNGRGQAAHSGLSAQADQHGFVLANPDGGIAGRGQGFYWNVPGVPLVGDAPTPANAPDDVQFFRDAIDQMEHSLCIDPHRVYVTGFSGGARMASVLACELADRIAAVAPVAGLRAGVPQAGDFKTPDGSTCKPRRPVPILTFHGVHDPTNRFDGDGGPRWGYSVPTALARWASLDGCKPTSSEQSVSTHVTKVSYSGCRAGAELILYRTDAPVEHGGGHVWPHAGGSGSHSGAASVETVDELDASALIWQFFARHRS